MFSPRRFLSLAEHVRLRPECTPESPESRDHTCYLKRSDEKRNYVVYQALGLAVFFTPTASRFSRSRSLPERSEARRAHRRIATGKSTVTQMLRDLNAKVLDADEIAVKSPLSPRCSSS